MTSYVTCRHVSSLHCARRCHGAEIEPRILHDPYAFGCPVWRDRNKQRDNSDVDPRLVRRWREGAIPFRVVRQPCHTRRSLRRNWRLGLWCNCPTRSHARGNQERQRRSNVFFSHPAHIMLHHRTVATVSALRVRSCSMGKIAQGMSMSQVVREVRCIA